MSEASTQTDRANANENIATDAAISEQFSESGDDAHQTTERLLAMIEQLRGRELRAQAELENYRKRAARDTEQQIKFANVALVRDLLEVVDNLDRATAAAESAQEAGALLQGVRMVQQQLASILAKYHCFPIEAVGQPFDPNYHEAISQVPSDRPAGIVIQQASVGYRMHDRVIRPSHVVVSAGPSMS